MLRVISGNVTEDIDRQLYKIISSRFLIAGIYWLDCLMFIIFFSIVAIILLWHSLLKDKQSVTKAHRWGLCRRYTAYGLLYMSINCNWGCREVIIPFILFSVKWNPRLVCFNIDTHLDKPEKMSIRGWPVCSFSLFCEIQLPSYDVKLFYVYHYLF